MGSIEDVCEPVERTENAEDATKFEPRDQTQIKQTIDLPDELWLAILECPCTFPPEIFSSVMQNLIKNPNITSSHLFRADILYDSDQDHTKDSLLKHIKPEYQPRQTQWPNFEPTRTIVRKLIPRNFQLDEPLIQTCQNFERREDNKKQYTLVVYTAHVEKSSDMPFYHPTVSQLAFLHTWHPENNNNSTLTLLYHPFTTTTTTTTSSSPLPLTKKLSRTALKLLQTIHKHGQGRLQGYEKRVHLDRILSQKRYQDTYARLKAKYGKKISEKWVEVTDPGKHVFEDIGIAAFLMEVWGDLYQVPGPATTTTTTTTTTMTGVGNDEMTTTSSSLLPRFPGFVDIGCGNGLLTCLLLMEGYPGYGFDARNRKTWEIFPDHVQERLHQKILVPKVLQEAVEAPNNEVFWTDGMFERGTFVISNHADELTAWTPLLAYLNDSSFIAIPCCSHDLAGARFRAPQKTKSGKEAAATRLPQQNIQNGELAGGSISKPGQAAETGSLARTDAQKKMPSAYSTLCSYVTSLAEDVGFLPEQDVLRIPSTRNACIIGRKRITSSDAIEGKSSKVIEIVESELKRSISAVAADWIERAEKLLKKPSSGH